MSALTIQRQTDIVGDASRSGADGDQPTQRNRDSQLTAYRAATSSAELSAAQLARADEAGERRAEDAALVFVAAGFNAYGLDRRWTGFRFFGGHGSSDGRIHTLTLGHCDVPGEPDGQDIRVETCRIDARAGDSIRATQITVFTLTHSQLEHFWQETGVLSEDVRQAAFLAQGPDVDRTAPWATVVVPVDGETTAFRVLAHEPFWVAQVVRGGVVIGIRARHWNIADTGLVTVRNTNAYADGTQSPTSPFPSSRATRASAVSSARRDGSTLE
jgi:hypothetical protein